MIVLIKVYIKVCTCQMNIENELMQFIPKTVRIIHVCVFVNMWRKTSAVHLTLCTCTDWLCKYELKVQQESCKWMVCIWARNELFVLRLVCSNSCLQSVLQKCHKYHKNLHVEIGKFTNLANFRKTWMTCYQHLFSRSNRLGKFYSM